MSPSPSVPTWRRRRGPQALVVSAVALLVIGCGVPMDQTATVAPDADVPYDLLSSTTTTTPPSGSPAEGETTICLAVDGLLLSLGRDRGGDPPLSTLEALVGAGPTEGESSLGLRSVVEGVDLIDGIEQAGNVGEVSLGGRFAELAADQQLLAVAQLTCTLTSQPGIDTVTFQLDGDDVEVPVESGELVDRPVARADFGRLIAN